MVALARRRHERPWLAGEADVEGSPRRRVAGGADAIPLARGDVEHIDQIRRVPIAGTRKGWQARRDGNAGKGRTARDCEWRRQKKSGGAAGQGGSWAGGRHEHLICSNSGSSRGTSPPKTHTRSPRQNGTAWWCHMPAAGAVPDASHSCHCTTEPSFVQKDSRVSASRPPATGSPRSCPMGGSAPGGPPSHAPPRTRTDGSASAGEPAGRLRSAQGGVDTTAAACRMRRAGLLDVSCSSGTRRERCAMSTM